MGNFNGILIYIILDFGRFGPQLTSQNTSYKLLIYSQSILILVIMACMCSVERRPPRMTCIKSLVNVTFAHYCSVEANCFSLNRLGVNDICYYVSDVLGFVLVVLRYLARCIVSKS